MKNPKRKIARRAAKRKANRRFAEAPGSATLRELANTFRRMGDDANHVRLTHLNDPKICEPWASAADAYYNCMRTVRRLLPNEKAERPEAMGHAQIETTAGYCHATALSVPSPLEVLA